MPAVAEIETRRSLEPEALAEAFGAFSTAAQTLERSYVSLEKQVGRLRAELEQERDLRRRREALAQISALLAHEIRNPLGSLELFAGLLAGSALGEQEKEWVEQIQAGLRILSATVNNILEFHSQRPLQLAPVELNAALHSVEALLAPLAGQAQMRWVRGGCGQPLSVRADRHRLQQVFLNLALNALRFAAQGGILRVSAFRHGETAVITFEDQGPGIAAEAFEKIFDPGAGTRSAGVGLGLAVSKRIVEQHGGRISARSVPGQGACFELRFPLAEQCGGAAQ